MITENLIFVQGATWQQQLTTAITDPLRLLHYLKLPASLLEGYAAAQQQFPLKVPHAYLRRIRKGDPQDPLLLQILPLNLESKKVPGFVLDPLKETAHNPLQGLLHKYKGRVLLLVNSACAIHCRYCFRRHFSYQNNSLSRQHFVRALTYIEQNKSIQEVILSGGDPLVNSDRQLDYFITQLASIPHVKRLRLHSRLPVVLPDRITPTLVKILTSTKLKSLMVIHCNHANEIDERVILACRKMTTAGIPLLNQSVLLRSINNTVETLIALSEALFHAGVLPYYLHLLDKVAGSAHFEVTQTQGKRLLTQMAARCSGYLVPKLAQEIPDHYGKKIIF